MSGTLTLNTDPFALAKELSGKHLINGALVAAVSGQTFDVVNPATGQVVAQAAKGDAADVDAAVAAAVAAQKEWKRRPARERGKLVAECGRRLTEHTEELARLVALETGKALRTESRVEAGVLADAFVFYGGLASELKGESVPFNPDMLTVTVREPIGVVGAIIPWNVPLMLMALKIAPALVAGNTVVVKSAEEAPLTVLRVCQILNDVLPPGCFNMLSGFGHRNRCRGLAGRRRGGSTGRAPRYRSLVCVGTYRGPAVLPGGLAQVAGRGCGLRPGGGDHRCGGLSGCHYAGSDGCAGPCARRRCVDAGRAGTCRR